MFSNIILKLHSPLLINITAMEFEQKKMVNWFEPAQLASTGLKAIISGTFAHYADKRDLEAALDREEKPIDFSANEIGEMSDEIWFDYISDTGDGFNSTYSVASMAARNLKLSTQAQDLFDDGKSNSNLTGYDTKSGSFLILGGDEVYPTPSMEEYDNRFKGPFDAASKKFHANGNERAILAIPGNHDWYDGLSNFLKIFTQDRWVGNWRTIQRRSYFAVKLPHNYWLWATDVQLNSDIDGLQLDYFQHIAVNFMKEGDKVILATAEPSWVYKEIINKDSTYKRLKYFEQVYITDDAYGLIGKKFKLVAMLTGDLHHYSHYTEQRSKDNTIHYITAGGGGAFMHSTNVLPETLIKLGDDKFPFAKSPTKTLKRKPDAVFPSVSKSRALLLWNFLFIRFNYAFCFTIGMLYFLTAFSLRDYITNPEKYVGSIYISKVLDHPLAVTISLLLAGGLYAFADITKSKWFRLWGAAHGSIQTLVMILSAHVVLDLNGAYWQQESVYIQVAFFMLSMMVAGILFSGIIMGVYLYLSVTLFNLHVTEASSAFIYEHCKNFLRFHISKDGVLTIFPVGIEKVCTKWKKNGKDETVTFDAMQPIKYKIIEDPIVV